MKDNKKVLEVIDTLKKIASTEASSKEKKVSAEDAFNAELLTGFNGITSPEDFGQKVASAIIENLEKQTKENEVNVEKDAGVIGAPLVMNETGVHANDPGDPTLGKTVTTRNEIEKGIVAKDKTAIVNAIIAQLLGTYGVGPSTITTSGEQVMITPGTKTAELDKEASEKKASADKVVNNLFEKFATVSNETEKKEVIEDIVKYASAAEDILVEKVGENNYDENDVEKIAEALIMRDAQVFAKQAELEESGRIIADSFLNRLDEVGKVEMQKQALADSLLKQAEDLLNEKAPGKYTEDDTYRVAEALYNKMLASEKTDAPTTSVVDQVISTL